MIGALRFTPPWQSLHQNRRLPTLSGRKAVPGLFLSCLAALLDQRVAPGFVYLEMCSLNNVVVPGRCAGFFPWASVSCSFRCDQLVHQNLVVSVDSLRCTTLVVIMIILPSAMLVSRRVFGVISCSYLLHPTSIHKSHMRHAYEPDTVPEIWTVHKATNATTSLHAERGANNDTLCTGHTYCLGCQ